ncbi:hypothetical protein U1Q18_019627 [Sarracenia purpurea var. burkii]
MVVDWRKPALVGWQCGVAVSDGGRGEENDRVMPERGGTTPGGSARGGATWASRWVWICDREEGQRGRRQRQ